MAFGDLRAAASRRVGAKRRAARAGFLTMPPTMATLRDVRPVLREVGLWGFVRRVWQQMNQDHVFVYASALSYAWLFAFFPMLVFLLSMIPFLPEQARQGGQDLLFKAIEANFPQQTAEWILNNPRLRQLIDLTLNDRKGAVMSLSLVVALWAASNGLSAVMTALDRCYEVEDGRPYYLAKPISLLLTVIITALVLLVMVLIPIGTFIRNRLVAADYTVPLTDIRISTWIVTAFDIGRHALGLAAGFVILSLIYNVCPSVRMRWRLVTPGAVVCFASWVLIGLGFRMYLNLTGGTHFAQNFGPAAGVAILLLVFYLYAVMLLVGAEVNSEIDKIRLKPPPGTKDLRPLQKELDARERAERKRLKADGVAEAAPSAGEGSPPPA